MSKFKMREQAVQKMKQNIKKNAQNKDIKKKV